MKEKRCTNQKHIQLQGENCQICSQKRKFSRPLGRANLLKDVAQKKYG